MSTWNNRLCLLALKAQLEMHKPPLCPKTVNKQAIMTREDNTIIVNLHDGQRLEVEAEVLPGKIEVTVTSPVQILQDSFVLAKGLL